MDINVTLSQSERELLLRGIEKLYGSFSRIDSSYPEHDTFKLNELMQKVSRPLTIDQIRS